MSSLAILVDAASLAPLPAYHTGFIPFALAIRSTTHQPPTPPPQLA
jgi:hypothetical protein